jgi:hypothetical protein
LGLFKFDDSSQTVAWGDKAITVAIKEKVQIVILEAGEWGKIRYSKRRAAYQRHAQYYRCETTEKHHSNPLHSNLLGCIWLSYGLLSNNVATIPQIH